MREYRVALHIAENGGQTKHERGSLVCLRLRHTAPRQQTGDDPTQYIENHGDNRGSMQFFIRPSSHQLLRRLTEVHIVGEHHFRISGPD